MIKGRALNHKQGYMDKGTNQIYAKLCKIYGLD